VGPGVARVTRGKRGSALTRPRYDSAYFQLKAAGERSSAEAIVPILMSLLEPRSVCDVGCSQGSWLAVFKEHGVERVIGIDGDYVERDELKIDESEFVAADLERGVPEVGHFDLALSLEVAEHLIPEAAAPLVDGLVALAPAVLFSAAIPGQGGRGHVSERWPEYWRDLFARHGYVPIDCVRDRVWLEPDVNVWYRQNTLLFAERKLIESHERLREAHSRSADRPLSVVHPLILQAALERPWKYFRQLLDELQAGAITPDDLKRQMGELLERFATRARERSVRSLERRREDR
jgi:SAM-dependent methyltransferase